MSALQVYTRATAGLLAAQGSVLLLSPSIGTWLLCSAAHNATPLEAILSRLLALAQLTLSFLTLLFSGDISALYNEGASMASPLATPTLSATAVYHAIVGIVLYTSSYDVTLSSTWLSFCAATSLSLAGAGLLLLLFGSGTGHISRRTGADKRTSGWPFKNAEADRKRR